ncbi:hypothetical protein DPMN_065034 [Dreissena polymorpha]|uniref:Uncharacterized protein n=1 Tax=Dreissena polymorpha TaxID=45954 RepID=A0A9D4CEQ4_DREPO|nr:hypothetical protein DPMN_065034 [Dreissena polymorpha]
MILQMRKQEMAMNHKVAQLIDLVPPGHPDTYTLPVHLRRILHLSTVSPIKETSALLMLIAEALAEERALSYRQSGCVTDMLQKLDLPPLQDRRRAHRLTLWYKMVKGHLPSIPIEHYL